MNMLKIDNLSLNYAGQPLFADFCMSVKQGEKAHLIGPSGCGKSSVFSCILGFIPDYTGEITIAGELLTPHTAWQLRKQIAYVPQEADLGQGTVQEAINQPFAYKANVDILLDTEQMNSLMDRFNLPTKVLTQPVTELSGGEKQRVAIIIAALLKRKIYLFDEPTSALDANNRTVFANFLAEQTDWTAIFIAHDKDIAGLVDVTFDLTAH